MIQIAPYIRVRDVLDENGNSIPFTQKVTKDGVKITLPQLAGYKITRVRAFNHQTNKFGKWRKPLIRRNNERPI